MDLYRQTVLSILSILSIEPRCTNIHHRVRVRRLRTVLRKLTVAVSDSTTLYSPGGTLIPHPVGSLGSLDYPIIQRHSAPAAGCHCPSQHKPAQTDALCPPAAPQLPVRFKIAGGRRSMGLYCAARARPPSHRKVCAGFVPGGPAALAAWTNAGTKLRTR
jgi:hypothetical protein